MNIKLTPAQAESVHLEADELFVRSCMYLGIGLIQIRDIQTAPFNAEVKTSYIESAREMGMSDEDTVTRV